MSALFAFRSGSTSSNDGGKPPTPPASLLETLDQKITKLGTNALIAFACAVPVAVVGTMLIESAASIVAGIAVVAFTGAAYMKRDEVSYVFHKTIDLLNNVGITQCDWLRDRFPFSVQ